VHHAADTLGLAIANWITMLSIDAVILGGGVVEALGEPFVDRVRKSFDRWVFPARCRDCALFLSSLGDLAGVYGAAQLAATRKRGSQR
jgi:glucokinase